VTSSLRHHQTTMMTASRILIALALLLATCTATHPFLSGKSGKSGCVAVNATQCSATNKFANCLECGSGSGYNCLKCCPGCTLNQKMPGYSYCDCNGKGPSPSPAPIPGITTATTNMTWAGKERVYVSHIPTHPPTGLIVILEPVDAPYLPFSCSGYASIANETGAAVVCPAALNHPGTKGGASGPCWKAWGNFGTCGLQNDSEDVDYIAAVVQRMVRAHSIPAGKVIMSGMSNGGSMAYRFNCERSDLIGGLAIQSQAYFDPYVGFYDYDHSVVPFGTPQCKPSKRVLFYSDVGTVDVYYGLNVSTPGFQGLQKWRDNYSTAVLGCTGGVTQTSQGPHEYPDGTAPATCYEYASCPGITGAGLNRFCSVPGMGHDATGFYSLLPRAFADFFGSEVTVLEE